MSAIGCVLFPSAGDHIPSLHRLLVSNGNSLQSIKLVVVTAELRVKETVHESWVVTDVIIAPMQLSSALCCASLRIGLKQLLCVLHTACNAGDAACCSHRINPLLLFWPDATCR